MARVQIEEAFPGELRELGPERRARFALTVKRQVEEQLGLTEFFAKSLGGRGEVDAVAELVERVQAAFVERQQRLIADVVRVVREGGR